MPAPVWYGPPPPGGVPPGPPRGTRRPLIITLIAATTVIVLVSAVVAFFAYAGGEKDKPDVAVPTGSGVAGDLVKSYLEALSKGDAAAALALGDAEPGNNQFLTAEILKQQIAKWPITNIEILQDPSKSGKGDYAYVRVAANFGDQRSEGQVPVRRSDQGWKLETAAYRVPLIGADIPDSLLSTLTVFGKPVGNASTIYVFPGYLEFGSTTRYLSVTAKPLLLDTFNTANVIANNNLEMVLNDDGNKAVINAVQTWLDACMHPGPRPVVTCPEPDLTPEYDRNTITLKGPMDMSKVKPFFLGTTAPNASGSVDMAFTVKDSSGQIADFTYTVYLNQPVDITKDPPVVE